MSSGGCGAHRIGGALWFVWDMDHGGVLRLDVCVGGVSDGGSGWLQVERGIHGCTHSPSAGSSFVAEDVRSRPSAHQLVLGGFLFLILFFFLGGGVGEGGWACTRMVTWVRAHGWPVVDEIQLLRQRQK